MVPTIPGKSWKVQEFEKVLEKSWIFFVVKHFKRGICQETTAFCGLPLYVKSSSSLTNCCDFHVRYIGCNNVNNVYIYSAHYLLTVIKFAIKGLIYELQKCMFNPSATVIILFDLSPFETC